jgi:chorismate synthase
VIECVITGVPAGIGDPVFDKLDARFAQALMSIGAVKAVEIGDGVKAALSTGSLNNDEFYMADGTVSKHTNHAGGILGGISDGSPIICRAHVKPTPSIAKPQNTINSEGREVSIEIKGRHDPVIAPRAVVVIESMVAVTLLDLLIQTMSSDINSLKSTFKDR